ncbi:hypothetical protein MMC28_006359 [Mycoblastus sanguinarius]|nr:hypothetical protein [Mycoblastus sanguinarius]
MSPSNLLPFFFLLLAFSPLPSVSAQGTISLYLDSLCSERAYLIADATLLPNTCLATHGVQSIEVNDFADCSSSETATLIMYNDTSCTASIPGTKNNACLSYTPDKAIPAVMFACAATSAAPAPTSTSWLSAMSSAAPTTTATPNFADGAAPSTTPASSTQTSLSSSSRPTSSHENTTSSSANSGTDSGASQGNQIALGVGLGVGVPTVVIALLAWCCPKPWKKRKKQHGAEPRPLRMHYIPTTSNTR